MGLIPWEVPSQDLPDSEWEPARERRNWRPQAGPIGQRERAHARERDAAPTGGVHLSADAGMRGLAASDWAVWAEKSFLNF